MLSIAAAKSADTCHGDDISNRMLDGNGSSGRARGTMRDTCELNSASARALLTSLSNRFSYGSLVELSEVKKDWYSMSYPRKAPHRLLCSEKPHRRLAMFIAYPFDIFSSKTTPCIVDSGHYLNALHLVCFFKEGA